MTDELMGKLWHPDTPGRSAPAALRFAPGRKPKAVVASAIVDEPGVTYEATKEWGSVSESLLPDDKVAAFAPLTLIGIDEEGRRITLLGAQGGYNQAIGMPFGQLYEAPYAIRGAHVSKNSTYRAVRFHFGFMPWISGLEPGDSQDLPCGGTLSYEEDGDQRHLVFTVTEPVEMTEFVDQVVLGSQTFAQLMFSIPVPIAKTELLIDCEWVEVISANLTDTEKSRASSYLLDPAHFTVHRLASWLTLFRTLDGLAIPVVNPPTGAEQLTLLTLSSVVEGMHRRIRPQRKRFEIGRNAMKRVRQASRTAGLSAFTEEGFTDEATATEALNSGLGHLDDLPFRARVEDFALIANDTAPEVLESLPLFPADLVSARNELAHHLLPKAGESFDARVTRWHMLSRTIPWVLRIVLLRELGVPSETIRSGLMSDNAFQFYRANSKADAASISVANEGEDDNRQPKS